jgi:hypothetical protein
MSTHSFVVYKGEINFTINASCLTCICNLLYWNRDIRQKLAFDTQFYKLMFKRKF